MKLAKRTYSLPPSTLERYERQFAPGERSKTVAKLMEEWLAERERAELRCLVVEGCQEMAGLYQEVDQEWNGSADEIWHEISE